jgi:hypothetical protein
MIELSILDLLYLVLTFFLVIVGTLLTLVLLRTLKILAVWVELADYYWQVKKLFTYYSQVPFVIKDKIFDYLAWTRNETEEVKDPII